MRENAAIAFINLSDSESVGIVASSSIIEAPPAILKDPRVAEKWRGRNGETEYLLIDLDSVQSIDTVMLLGLNLTLAGITRIRVSAVDSSGETGEAHDSLADDGRVDPEYGALIYLLDEPVMGRYIRIDLTEPDEEYIEAGRLGIFLRSTFNFNYPFGWEEAPIDESIETQSRSGQDYIDVGPTRRCWTVRWPWLTLSERNSYLQQLDRWNGIRKAFLFIGDPGSDNLGRDSIWGRVKEIPATVPIEAFEGSDELYSKAYKIYETL